MRGTVDVPLGSKPERVMHDFSENVDTVMGDEFGDLGRSPDRNLAA